MTSDLVRWADAHHGLISLDAWVAHGRSTASFYRACHQGLLRPLAPRVGALAGARIGERERIAAGLLSFGPGAVASHRSAAALWGAPVPGRPPVDLIVPGRNSPTRTAGFVVHRPIDRMRLRAVTRHGLATTTPQRTLLELGAVAPTHVRVLLERLLVGGAVTLRSVETALTRHRRRGRAGVAALDRAVRALDGFSVSDSALEFAAADVFRRAGIAGWETHAPIGGYIVDFVFRAERLIVEVDGWRWHCSPRSFDDDRDRDFDLASQGWLVVRVTWRTVVRRPATAAARLRATLAVRSPSR